MSVLGAIVRGDLGSGLQAQTHALTRMLRPARLLYVDSTSFNGAEQHPEMYDGFPMEKTIGFPSNMDAARFMRGLTHLITAETVYNPKFCEIARIHGAKVFIQPNWEFLDHFVNPRLPMPYMWLMPSYWKLEDMQAKFGKDKVVYLPPPIIQEDFHRARLKNFGRTGKRRFVHIMGKVATNDRNGTFDLIDALKYSTGDYELVIRSQFNVPEYMDLVDDPRVRFEIGNIVDRDEMYYDFDAMIMPRRYGGLCLPMNEAVASSLPVIMPDISPNNRILPQDWLVQAKITHAFQARTSIDVVRSDVVLLGKKIDWLAGLSDEDMKQQKLAAWDVFYENFESRRLKEDYIRIMEL